MKSWYPRISLSAMARMETPVDKEARPDACESLVMSR